MMPTSTEEWKALPPRPINVLDIRPRAGSAGFWPTVWKLFRPRSRITDDYCIYLIESPYGFILVDGHHRLRAALWRRKEWIWARVAYDEGELLLDDVDDLTIQERLAEIDRIASGWVPSVDIDVEEMMRER